MMIPSLPPKIESKTARTLATIGGSGGAAGIVIAVVYYLLTQVQAINNIVAQHTIELKYEKESTEEFRNDKIRIYDKIADLERKEQSLDAKIQLLNEWKSRSKIK
jgi:hypothetical protein